MPSPSLLLGWALEEPGLRDHLPLLSILKRRAASCVSQARVFRGRQFRYLVLGASHHPSNEQSARFGSRA